MAVLRSNDIKVRTKDYKTFDKKVIEMSLLLVSLATAVTKNLQWF